MSEDWKKTMVAEKGKMLLEIVAPSRQVVRSERVEEVIAPRSEGEFGVLPGHAPFLTTLKSGMLSYREGADWHYLAVDWGYAEVGPNRVIILAEGADRAAEGKGQRPERQVRFQSQAMGCDLARLHFR